MIIEEQKVEHIKIIESFLLYLEVEKGVSKHTLKSYKGDLFHWTEYMDQNLNKDKTELGKKLEIRRICPCWF